MDYNVCYISDPRLLEECSKVPNIGKRAYLVDSLIKSYRLCDHMDVLKVTPSSYEDLVQFHSSSYVDFLKNANDKEGSGSTLEEDEYGIGYDCPVVKNMWSFVTYVAGGSLTAAKALATGRYRFAINWCGGWHHAQRDSAGGFCYVNDVVLAVETLRRSFGRVLYVDLDVHHGDGVENAYAATDRVLTLSLHQYEPGFYPTSGALGDVGTGNGRCYAVNVPLREGAADGGYAALFRKIGDAVRGAYDPGCVVVQCGADGLAGDPAGGFNLTPMGALAECVKTVTEWTRPALFLGGGGYNGPNVARCWTYLTAVITGQDGTLNADIPDDDEYFSRYGPDFTLDVNPGNRKDHNSPESLDNIFNTVAANMEIVKEHLRVRRH